jgi:hypothetical protein
MTYENPLLAQADPGIVSGSTIERKKMSKKTSFKRIALVAVAGLVSGLVSVAPANAAAGTPVISDPTDGYVAVGSAYSATTTFSFTGAGATDAATLSAAVSGPTGSTATTVTFGTGTSVTAGGATFTPATGVLLQGATANGSVAATVPLSFTPDVAGTYTITLTNTAGTTATQSYTVKAAGLAYSLGDGAAVTPATTGNGIAGPANTVTVNATTNASNTRSLVTVSGAGATINSNAGTALTAGATSAIVAAGTNAAIIINTPSVGTITVSQFYESGNGTGIYASTASKTATITVGAAAVNGTLSVANSTSYLDATIASDNAAWSSITADETGVFSANDATVSNNSTLEVAVIKVVLKDTLGNLMPDATAVSATITGSGSLAIGATQQSSAAGRSVSTVTASSAGAAFISVYRDGVAGKGTITISVGSTVVATESVTFYGTATKYTATTNIVAAANGTTSTDVVTVCATDAAGVVVPGHTIYAFSGDTTVATISAADASGDATEATAIVASGTSMANHVAATAIGCVGFSIDALTQTTKPSVVLTFGNASTIATSTVTTTATVLVGEVAATTIALSTDKATYAPGAAVALTLTFKDSVGRPVAFGPGTGTLAAALNSSQTLGTAALLGTANISKLGTTVQTVYAPLSPGAVTVTGTTGADTTYTVATARGLALTTSFTVTTSTEMASLTLLINSLIKKINALSTLVAKIQKKLGVK